MGQSDVSERVGLLTGLAAAEDGLEHWESRLAYLQEALKIATGLGDRGVGGKTLADLADALLLAGRFEDALKLANQGLSCLETEADADQVRLLATLGQAHAATASYQPALEAMQRALDLSQRLAIPRLTARVLRARSIVNFHYLRSRESLADGLQGERLDSSEDSPWLRAVHLRTLHQTLLYLARPAEAAEIANRLLPLSARIGQSDSAALCMLTQARLECGRAPDFAKFEHAVEQVAQASRSRHAFLDALLEVQQSLIDFFRANWTSGRSALSHAQAASQIERGYSIQGFGIGMAFRIKAYASDHEGALAILNGNRNLLPLPGQPNTRGSWFMLASTIEGLMMLGERAQAGQLYPLTSELIETGTTVLWPISRFVQTIAGIAASAGGHYDAAEEHFRSAMRDAESFPDLLEQAEIRRFHAMMLIDRGSTADPEEGKSLLEQGLRSYDEMGMPRHREMTRALLDRIGTNAP